MPYTIVFSLICQALPAGFGTTALLPVAGRHRASPSTSLDKSIFVIWFMFHILTRVPFFVKTILHDFCQFNLLFTCYMPEIPLHDTALVRHAQCQHRRYTPPDCG